jgi:hypothetical protein
LLLASTEPHLREKPMQDLNTFLPALQKALAEQQFEAVLQALAVDAVSRSGNAANQGNLTGIAVLDDLCAQAATAIARAHPDARASTPVDKDLTIYIATDLYWGHGGHTPLLMDLIKVDKSPRKELLLSVIGGGAKNAEFAHQLTQALPDGVGVQQLTADTLLQKVLILRSYLRSKRPGRIILVTHQYDTVVYCGLTADCAPQIINIHHADTFTLGLHIPWYILVGTNLFFTQAVANAIGRGMFYWPIAAEDQGVRPWNDWLAGEPLHTCSHGASRKFEGRNGLDYEDIVTMRLQMLPGDHYHIGDLSAQRLATLAERLGEAGLDTRRFIYVGPVPSLWRYLKQSSVHLCISSFPVCGPKGLVETKGCGIPVLMYEDTQHPARSALQFCYADCLHWRDAEELRAALQGLTPEALRLQAQLSRADYEKMHSMQRLGECATIPETYVAPVAYRAHPA